MDEVSVLGVAAAVDEEGDLVLAVDLRHRVDIFHRDGLPAAGVVGDRHHAEGDFLRPGLFDEGLQLVDVHVALEGMVDFGVEGFVDDQVGRASAAGADVGVGGVEVHVRGDIVAGLDQSGGQNVLGGASLVGGDEECEAEDIVHGFLQAVEGTRAGVRFVAAHDGRPLVLAHGAGA